MARYSRFSHQRLMPILRRCHRTAAAENIAVGSGQTSARTFVRMWMRSPSHRHNLLNRKYRYIGVAAWRSARLRSSLRDPGLHQLTVRFRWAPPAGFEPATPGTGNQCSIP